jgi:hypothetical protein
VPASAADSKNGSTIRHPTQTTADSNTDTTESNTNTTDSSTTIANSNTTTKNITAANATTNNITSTTNSSTSTTTSTTGTEKEHGRANVAKTVLYPEGSEVITTQHSYGELQSA